MKNTEQIDPASLSRPSLFPDPLFPPLPSGEEKVITYRGEFQLMPRSFVQACLPYSRVKGKEYVRKSGKYTLYMYGPEGLPYGSIPRLLLAYLTTQAIRTRNRTIYLGSSMSEFLSELGLHRSGGSRGDATRLRKQVNLLFGTFISLRYHDETGLDDSPEKEKNLSNLIIADEAHLVWEPKKMGSPLFSDTGGNPGYVVLNQNFYDEIIDAPIPVSMNALKALKNSPMALDMYIWLFYRSKYLKSPVKISWDMLSVQFGSNYSRTVDFKKAFLSHLKTISSMYPSLRFSAETKYFQLLPPGRR